MDGMIQKKTFNIHIFLISLLLYALCYFLLTQIFMFWEVSWHIEGSKRMLNGGTYLTNLYDDNSPAVFMYYLPYALLSKLSVLSTPNLANLYILLTYAIGSYFTYQVLKCKAISTYALYSLYFSSIIWSLFFGITMLGERESIIFCLLVPYIYMNLFERENLSKTKQIFVSLLAAISISQAPFYIIIPMVIDIIDCIVHRKKTSLYQNLFYVFSIVIFEISYLLYPEYYIVLLKLLYHFQAGINQPYHELINRSLIFSSAYSTLIILFFSIFFYRKLIYMKIISMIFLALLIYFLEHKAWFYHFYPTIFLSILAFTVIHIDNKNSVNKNNSQIIIKNFLLFSIAISLLIDLSIIASRYMGNYDAYHNKNSPLNQLIKFSKTTNPNYNKTLFIDTKVFPAYLLKLYGGLNVISSWGNNWMLPALIKFKHQPNQIKEYAVGKRILFQLTSNTLTQQKPEYIFYYQSENIPYIVDKNFNVLNYLKQNKAIRHELKKYRPYRKIAQYIILKRKVQS